MWLFNDPSNHSWVSKTPWKNPTSSGEEKEATDDRSPLPGNGYAYGQIAHLIAWIYAVLGAGQKSAAEEIAVPTKVYCNMSHAPKTGADISFAAVITCCDGVTFALSGTALLPGSQYADPPIGKHINIELYGEEGSLMYGGDDKIPGSGRLQLRRSEVGKNCQPEYPCSDQDWSGLLEEPASELKDGFYFEDGEQEGRGPGSLKAFLDACRTSCTGKKASRNDSFIGLRTVQIMDAMYRSSISGNAEEIDV
jgi:predicted dehydrogenase